MALTGSALLALVLLVAVAAPVACILFWMRVRGRRSVRHAQRIALVMVCQISMVLFVGVALNDSLGFYVSWADLVGRSSRGLSTAHFGALADSRVGSGSRGPAGPAEVLAPGALEGPPDIPAAADGWRTDGWSQRPQWPDRGAIVITTVSGPVSDLKVPAWVYLPPAYFHRGADARRMPVVETLTGYPGAVRNLVTRLHYPDHLLTAMRAGTARPMVLVMMQPVPTYPWDTECTNVPNGPRALDFFTRDVPSSVAAQFGLQATAFGSIGDSTGGYCAAKLAIFDPAHFRAAVTMSGYNAPAGDRTTRGIFRRAPVLRQQNDLIWHMTHVQMPKTSVLVGTARDATGNDGYKSARALLGAVRGPMSADELLLEHGGHNFGTWNEMLPYAMPWLSRHLLGPVAPVPSLADRGGMAGPAVPANPPQRTALAGRRRRS